MVTALVLLIFFALVLSPFWLGIWLEFNDGHKPCPIISFNSFMKWYSINPNSYECSKTDLCKISVVRQPHIRLKHCYISFNLVDFWRYRLWLKKCEKLETKIEVSSEYKNLLESVQKDIDDFKQSDPLED